MGERVNLNSNGTTVAAEAQHAFFNDQRPEVYDAPAAADAWAKTLAFFRREL